MERRKEKFERSLPCPEPPRPRRRCEKRRGGLRLTLVVMLLALRIMPQFQCQMGTKSNKIPCNKSAFLEISQFQRLQLVRTNKPYQARQLEQATNEDVRHRARGAPPAKVLPPLSSDARWKVGERSTENAARRSTSRPFCHTLGPHWKLLPLSPLPTG